MQCLQQVIQGVSMEEVKIVLGRDYIASII